MNILYVEDNFQNFRLVMRMLRRDHDLTQAENGETGLKMAAEMKPDLILMDINLPDIDGLEVTDRIRNNDELKHIPIIAVTANAMVGDRERILEAGCDGYVRKPIDRTELKETIAGFKNGSNGSKPAAEMEKQQEIPVAEKD